MERNRLGEPIEFDTKSRQRRVGLRRLGLGSLGLHEKGSIESSRGATLGWVAAELGLILG